MIWQKFEFDVVKPPEFTSQMELQAKGDTSFIFVPLPKFKPFPGFEVHWGQALGPQAADPIRFAAIVRSAAPDDATFAKYMTVLKVMGAGRLVSEWMNCFSPRQVVRSEDARAEYLTTVWNYLSFCHQRILSFDETQKDDLKKIKDVLHVCQSLVDVFKYVVGNLQHEIFTPKHGELLQAYQNYIVSLWQLAVANNGNVPKKAVARVALLCLEQANAMERGLHFCVGEFKEFFKVVSEMARKYFRGFGHYLMGMQKMGEKQYGEAIAWFRTGDEEMGAVRSDLTIAGEMVSAVRTLRETLKAKASEAQQLNVSFDRTDIPSRVDITAIVQPLELFKIEHEGTLATFYGQAAMPSYTTATPSATPSPAPAPAPAPGSSGAGVVFQETSTPPVFTPGQRPARSAPVQPPAGGGGPPVFTPVSGPPPQFGPGQAGGPPKFTPGPSGGGPPQFTPGPSGGGPPQFTPAPSGGGPPQFTPESHSGPAQSSPAEAPPVETMDDDPSADIPWLDELKGCVADMIGDESFPMWGIVKSMKEGVIKRIGELQRRVPKMRQALAAYAGQIKQATATDQYIQNMINQQKIAPSAQGEQNINAMLERAAGFYNELELRLEQIGGME